MVSWLEIASVLAKESAFRSARSRQSMRTWRFWRGSGSIVEANIIPVIIYSVISIFFGIAMFLSKSPFIFGAVGAMELTISLFSVAASTSIMTSQGLLEPLRYRPIDDPTLRKSVMAASLLYWGIGSSVLLVIPGSIIAAFAWGSLYPIIAGIAMAIGLLILAYGIGLFIASIAPSVHSDPRLRLLATIGWIVFMLAGYIPSMLSSIFGRTLPISVSELEPLLELIPPFNFGSLAIGHLSPLALISSLLTLAMSVIVLRFSSNRLWMSLIQGPAILAPSSRIPSGTARNWTVQGYGALFGTSMKDIRLLVRNPQRLAMFMSYPLILIMAFLPFLFRQQGPADAGREMLMKVIIPLVPSMGLLFGVLAEQSFYIEGEAAKELYRLPLTKRSIALSKTFSSLVAMLPAGLLICVIASYLLGPLVGIMTFVLLEVNTAASLSFNSSLTVSMLPTEPSSWSERSIGSKRPLIRIGLVLASIVLGGLFAVVAIVTPVGEIAFVGLSVLVLLIAAVAYQRLPDAPLTF